ncbi:tetratricopeptide repeat protein [Streptomyces griseoluteus]|uniref:tetratricopeptide repeat protein n=1 Tax=Streptomyces griseoluteus TaxID=29306 RepID=UPI0036FE2210
MPMKTAPERERRCAAVWDASEDVDAAQFRSRMAALTGELPTGHPVAAFELASAHDATGLGEDAAPLYRRALDIGLPDNRRRQAVIQPASTLRTLGQPQAFRPTGSPSPGTRPR